MTLFWLWLWASLATVLSFVLAILWHVERNDLEAICDRLEVSCDHAKAASTRAMQLEKEFDSLESKYLERCKELRDLRRQVSKSILSLAESAKDTSGDIS